MFTIWILIAVSTGILFLGAMLINHGERHKWKTTEEERICKRCYLQLVICTQCKGGGMICCPTCGGDGKIYHPTTDIYCEDWSEACSCGGGKKACPKCLGGGWVDPKLEVRKAEERKRIEEAARHRQEEETRKRQEQERQQAKERKRREAAGRMRQEEERRHEEERHSL